MRVPSRRFLSRCSAKSFLLTGAAVVFLVVAGPMRGADYYVSPAGLDSNPGTSSLPWLTIQKAADTLAPGDTVYVRTGTYARVSVHVSGSAAGGPVTFCNYPGEAPVIDAAGVTPPAGDTALFLVENRSNLVIAGFEMRNYQTSDTSLVPAGIFLGGACQHVQIRGCQVHGIQNTGGTTENAGNAFGIAVYGSSVTPATDILIDGNDVHDLKTGSSESVVLNGNVTAFQVTNNKVHDNNNIGIDFIGFEGTCPDAAQDQARDGLCKGNEVWNISSQGNQAYQDGNYSADGIYCDGATRVKIKRNLVHDNDIGIELASEHPGRVTSAILVRKNLVSANRQGGLFLGGYARRGTGGTEGCTVTGNTFDGNDTLLWDNGEAQVRFRTANCLLRDNTFSSGPSHWLVTVPVTAADNVNNVLGGNRYFSSAGATAARWSWNRKSLTGFDAWQRASGQDADSVFASEPPAVSLGEFGAIPTPR